MQLQGRFEEEIFSAEYFLEFIIKIDKCQTDLTHVKSIRHMSKVDKFPSGLKQPTKILNNSVDCHNYENVTRPMATTQQQDEETILQLYTAS